MDVRTDSPEPLTDHWSLHPWAPGETKRAWHLTFERSASLRAAFDALAPAAVDPALTPVPFEWAHLTIVSGAATTDLPPRDLLAAARPLEMAHVFVARESLMLLPDGDLDWLQAIWRSVADPGAVRAHGRMWPHVSFSYAHGPADPARLAGRLQEVALPPFEVSDVDLTLMRIRQDERCYRWEVLDQTPLC